MIGEVILTARCAEASTRVRENAAAAYADDPVNDAMNDVTVEGGGAP